jgi:hypothetical protein
MGRHEFEELINIKYRYQAVINAEGRFTKYNKNK